jgi:hypothetical protein
VASLLVLLLLFGTAQLTDLCGKVLQHAILADAMLLAQLRTTAGQQKHDVTAAEREAGTGDTWGLMCSYSTGARCPHLLPELAADLVAALPHLDVDDFPGHGAAVLLLLA